MDNIVPIENKDISKQLQRSFKKSGINIMTNSSVESVDTSGTGCKVLVKTKKGEETIVCDIVLSDLIGMQPNIENIGLEEVGINTKNDRITVDNYYQTNVPGYYGTVGDILSTQRLLPHIASTEELLVLKKLLVMIQILLIMEIYLSLLIVHQKYLLLE